MRFLIATSCVLGLLAGVGGCASTDYHYSQLLGTRYFRAPIDTYPVSILKVDGKGNVFKPALVDAGLHQITLQGPPTPAASTGKITTFSLDVAPCTRYYIVAVRANRLESDYMPRVDFSEPVPWCTPAKPA